MELWHALLIAFLVLLVIHLGAFLFLAKIDPSSLYEAPKPPKDDEPITAYNSNPGPCPSCGEVAWLRTRFRMVPGGAFRIWNWPNRGIASVAVFTCMNCESFGRYGMHHEAVNVGWVLLDRWAGGW